MAIQKLRMFDCLFLVLCLSFVFVLQVAFAQGSGTIKGRVLDKEKGDELIGVNIVIQNSSLGAATDNEGNYVIKNVPAGTYTLKVSYVGYKKDTREVTVTSGEVKEENFSLLTEVIVGEVVTVTAQAQGQIEAINQQLAAKNMVNIVSQAKIQELPDANAAEAIGRLPGVSTMRNSGEASKVVIRGVDPQYNLVAINGITLGGTGDASGLNNNDPAYPNKSQSQDRSTDISMISPNMLQSIEVHKTLLPDMEADAVGGYINMQLREAPSGFHTDLKWQSGYVHKSNTYNNFRATGDVSDRFFNDVMGVYFLANAEQYDRSADNLSSGYSVTSVNQNTGIANVSLNNIQLDRHDETRTRYGANLILDFKLPEGSISIINMGSKLISNSTDYTTNYDYSGQNIDYTLRYGKGTTDAATNSVQGKYDFGFVSADFSVSNSFTQQTVPHDFTFLFWDQSALKSISAHALVNQTPEYLIATTGASFDTTTRLYELGDGSYFFKDNGQTYAINFKIPFTLTTDISGYFKFGGKFQSNDRDNNQDNPYAEPFYGGSRGFNDRIAAQPEFSQLIRDPNNGAGTFWAYNFAAKNQQSLISNFLGNRWGNLIWAPTNGVLGDMMNFVESDKAYLNNFNNNESWYNGPWQIVANDYINNEKRSAAYSMAELNIGTSFSVTGGARFEEDVTKFTAYAMKATESPVGQQYLTVHSNTENHYWLPDIQAKYDVSENIDIRYAYTQTLARPSYTANSPYLLEDNTSANIYTGNPNLIPAESYNHDVMFTVHGNMIGLFSVSGFYKTIKNFIYATQYNIFPDSLTPKGFESASYFKNLYNNLVNVNLGSTQVNSWVNLTNNAYLKGVEVDWQTRFWYLPAPLNGLVFNVNYTHIQSNAIYPLKMAVTTHPTPKLSVTNFIDSSTAGPLVNQPNDIFNVTLGYDYKGFSGRISYLYQGKTIGYIALRPETDGDNDPYSQLDVSLRQQLPWKGLELYLNGTNLTEQANISRNARVGAISSEQFYGLTVDIGVRYIF